MLLIMVILVGDNDSKSQYILTIYCEIVVHIIASIRIQTIKNNVVKKNKGRKMKYEELIKL